MNKTLETITKSAKVIVKSVESALYTGAYPIVGLIESLSYAYSREAQIRNIKLYWYGLTKIPIKDFFMSFYFNPSSIDKHVEEMKKIN